MTAASYADAVAAAMTEAELLGNVRHMAGVLGWLSYHTHRSDRSEAGFPDLMLLRRSRLVAVELKSQKGRVTSVQQRWLDGLRAADVEVYVWRPGDWLTGVVERALR